MAYRLSHEACAFLDRTEGVDRGFYRQDGIDVNFFAQTNSLGVLLPSNSPGVNSLWLPSIALKIPVVIKPVTYAFAIAVVVVAAILSALLVRRRVDHLDLIGVLKTRE